MIHDTKDQLLERGFREVEQLTDDHGTIGYVVSFMGSNYVLVAKQYAYENMASFMAKLVVHAPEGTDFIFYARDDDRFTVFDGEYLKEHAEPSQGASKKRDCSWREIHRGVGADLHDYLSGSTSPKTLAGENETLEHFA